VARYDDFDRATWAARRTGPAVGAAAAPVGTVAAADVVDVYGPLAQLIAARADGVEPYVVAVTGSVAVGKSAAAAALAAAFGVDTERAPVTVVCTDGFLFPNAELEARGLTPRKGFPESFDHDTLTHFLVDVRRGVPEVHAPVYSHATYDIVPGATQVVVGPSVLILEGLPFPDEHVDFTVYLDADAAVVEDWYVARFAALCAGDDADLSPYFRMFRGADPQEIDAFARRVWTAVNLVNLEEHILPTRDGSDVILEKAADHTVRRIRLRVGADAS
jgi:type I pantothenate kinase